MRAALALDLPVEDLVEKVEAQVFFVEMPPCLAGLPTKFLNSA